MVSQSVPESSAFSNYTFFFLLRQKESKACIFKFFLNVCLYNRIPMSGETVIGHAETKSIEFQSVCKCQNLNSEHKTEFLSSQLEDAFEQKVKKAFIF